MSNKLLTDETGLLILQAIKELDTVALNKIGNLTSLNTLDKSSLVVAINELLTQRGALSGLNTTSKASVVTAINELVSANNTLSDTVSTLNTRTAVFANKNAVIRNSIYSPGSTINSFTSDILAKVKSYNNNDIFLGQSWGVSGYTVTTAGFYFFDNGDHNMGQHMVCTVQKRGTFRYNTSYYANPRYTESTWYTETRPQWLADMEAFFGAENLKTWPASELIFSDETYEVSGYANFEGKCELLTMPQVTGWPRTFRGKAVMMDRLYENEQLPLYRVAPHLTRGLFRDAVDCRDSDHRYYVGYVDSMRFMATWFLPYTYVAPVALICVG